VSEPITAWPFSGWNLRPLPQRLQSSGAKSSVRSFPVGLDQQAIAAEVPETIDARKRACPLLKRHGPEICKRTKPKCEKCPVTPNCAFFASRRHRCLESAP
jgi:hypothetical protein